jgi:hypothetical protein
VILVRLIVGYRDGTVALPTRRVTRCIRIAVDREFLLDRDRHIFVDRA